MDVFEAIGTCRAMRHLAPDPVPAELIDKILWAATRAPSPGNSQGWDFVVVDDPDPKSRIAAAIRDAMAARVAAMPRPDRTMRLMLDGTATLIDTLDRAPVIVFVTGPVIYPPAAPSEQFTWSALYPAAQNILIAARALGLGSVFTTLHMTAEPTVREVLGIPPTIRIAAMIPIGWPKGKFGPVNRRPVGDFVHRNRWEGDKRAAAPAPTPPDPHRVTFDLLSEEFQDDPAATFAALRTHCPVHHTTVPAEHYTLSRAADVFAALRDDATWSSKYGPGLAYGEVGTGVLVSSDPPQHTAERLAISRAFRPSVLEAMEPDIRALVTELIDAVVERGRGDLIRDVAMPLPLVVMCWMLGMPREDISMFRSWVLPMAEAVALEGGRAANDAVVDAYRQYYAYFGPHIRRRAEAIDAGDVVPDDLLTRLLTVSRDGTKLTHQQVVGFCQFLLVAGSATTTLLIGNVVDRLMRHPDQMALVRSDRSLVPSAIEESLRIDAPVHGLFRTNNCPVQLHGVDIPTDSKVFMLFGSANLDPDAWEEPDRFDVTRDLTDLRKRHAAFGAGIHYCLGAPLSRIEAAVALEAVLDRMPRIRPDGPPAKVKASVLKGFESLPVRWD